MAAILSRFITATLLQPKRPVRSQTETDTNRNSLKREFLYKFSITKHDFFLCLQFYFYTCMYIDITISQYDHTTLSFALFPRQKMCLCLTSTPVLSVSIGMYLTLSVTLSIRESSTVPIMM